MQRRGRELNRPAKQYPAAAGNLLYPTIKGRHVLPMLGITALGGWIGGAYGIVHDLFTYSISSEYFTQLKFQQFAWADIGLPARLFAAEIGFIATGAIGLIAGWFLARTAISAWPFPAALRKIMVGFLVIFLMALLADGIGYWLGLRHTADYSHWQGLGASLGVTNVSAFVRVAYIHNAGYIGGFVGLLIAISMLARSRRAEENSKRRDEPANA